MKQISQETHQHLNGLVKGMETARRPYYEQWKKKSEVFLNARMLSDEDNLKAQRKVLDQALYDSTNLTAAQRCAAGMMNGITSPVRPFLRIRVPGYTANSPVVAWYQQAQEDMLFAMAESNFFQALSTKYLDLCIYHTSAMFIFEDDRDIFRCYNYPVGTYSIDVDRTGRVNRFHRRYVYTVKLLIEEFGEENCSKWAQDNWEKGGAAHLQSVIVNELIEPNDDFKPELKAPPVFAYRRVVWEEKRRDENKLLALSGVYEWPGSVTRWEVGPENLYGVGPADQAMPYINEINHLRKQRLRGLDRQLFPPFLVDSKFGRRQLSLNPNAINYGNLANNGGVVPIQTSTVPQQDLFVLEQNLQARIQEIFYNDLFTMISQLDTVRSATEIDARREEKLIMLGPVLDRFHAEALDPIVKRIFSIMYRQGLFGEPPEDIEGLPTVIEYVSILNDARRALEAAPIERAAAFVGNMAGAYPQAMDIPNWDALISDYMRKIGVNEANINSNETIQAMRQARQQQEQAQEMMAQAPDLARGAQLLSETEVGGADNALGLILGNRQ